MFGGGIDENVENNIKFEMDSGELKNHYADRLKSQFEPNENSITLKEPNCLVIRSNLHI